MYELFGEMGSKDEINLLASNLLKEGDTESIYKLAKENGLDELDTEDFINGDLPELCTDLSAALGKLELEKKELGCKELMEDWVEFIIAQCTEEDANGELSFAKSVRKKGKSLAGALGAILAKSWEIKHPVNPKIIEAAGVGMKNARVEFGIPGVVTVRSIIKSYYGG